MALGFVSSSLPGCDEMISRILFDAHRRTVSDGTNLFLGLRPMKKGLIEEYNGEEINFHAGNGAQINGVHFKGTEPKAIIFLHGNGCFYETSGMKPIVWREALKRDENIPHLLLFNPRGTGESSGITQTHYVIEDFMIMFEYLVNECHVDPNHIAIGGHSMGGYFGLFGAAAIQQRYPTAKINFISDRSLWDLRSRVALSVESAGYSGLSASLATTLISSIISSPNWTRDSAKALESLKGRVFIIYHPKDGVILYKDSTHQGLLNIERVKEYFCLELSEEDRHAEIGSYPHNREFTDCENQKIVAELRRMLEIPPTSMDESLPVLMP